MGWIGGVHRKSVLTPGQVVYHLQERANSENSSSSSVSKAPGVKAPEIHNEKM